MVKKKSLSHQIEKLASLARFIDASQNAEETYAHLTRGVCEHSNWDLSGIQVLDFEAGITLPIYRFDPFNVDAAAEVPLWNASESPVGAVLEDGAPLVLQDAAEQTEYPGFRKDAIARGYHTTVVIPLGVKDPDGRPMVYTVASRNRYDLQEGDLQFLLCVAELSTIAIRKLRKLDNERREARRMRTILERMTSSLTTTLDRDAAGSLAAGLGTLFPAGWLAVDLTTGRGLYDPEAPPPIALNATQRLPNELLTMALKVREMPPDTRATFPFDGRLVTAEVNGLQIDGTHVGALFFFGDAALSHHERIAAQAGRLALSSFILRGFIEFKSRRVSASRLIQRLIRGEWRDHQELQDEADRLEFDLNQSCRLIVGAFPKGESLSDSTHNFILRSAQSLFGSTVSCVLDDRLIMLAGDAAHSDFAEKQKQLLSRIEPFLTEGILLVSSEAVDDFKRLPRAYKTCLNGLDVARSMGAKGWVTPANIGAFSSLMASADSQRMENFLSDILKGTLDQPNPKGQRALETLSAFLKSGRRYQERAGALNIHVSTLRYRLGQISDQVGIDYSDSDQCFELELALRLQGLKNSYET